ncbi:hypothetical protein DFA_00480 [Cavenderia fasciculata]|uniref:Uncharacterized protein n=1 Tax=Cavenderia fasciculata TaxID=261658 RepID=F4PS21_CACFS|nr:uncharacterized protein DFA_00480 [Cavenderia fasciculata]EGG20619.1 hypothetical protein DFA_00480 [Cavenderia fasciculata]|eukprot:XP_004358469.1 hypothetical protein DFA_00480 [Cavenderia fasciculata]
MNSSLGDRQDRIIVISNLYAIVRLYPKECLVQQYQHVVKIHRAINLYIKTLKHRHLPQEQKHQLIQTWVFIKDIFEENWDQVPENTREVLSNLQIGTLEENEFSLY